MLPIQHCPIALLPEESLLEVFAKPCLTAHNLAQCCRVNKMWRRLASDDTLWRQRFPIAAAQIAPQVEERFKDQLSCMIITTRTVVPEHFKQLANQVSQLGDACELICQSLSHPDCRTILRFGCGREPAASAFSREQLFLMQPVLQGELGTDSGGGSRPLHPGANSDGKYSYWFYYEHKWTTVKNDRKVVWEKSDITAVVHARGSQLQGLLNFYIFHLL